MERERGGLQLSRLTAVVISLLAAGGHPLVAQHPPGLGGVRLGDSTAAVLAVLGLPQHRQELLGVVAWDYPGRGLTVMWDRTRGRVRVLVLSKRAGDSTTEVRVGDPAHIVPDLWGEPTRVRQDGRFWDYVRPGWAATLEMKNGKVTTVTLQAAE